MQTLICLNHGLAYLSYCLKLYTVSISFQVLLCARHNAQSRKGKCTDQEWKVALPSYAVRVWAAEEAQVCSDAGLRD